jgi:hypothetical protein
MRVSLISPHHTLASVKMLIRKLQKLATVYTDANNNLFCFLLYNNYILFSNIKPPSIHKVK